MVLRFYWMCHWGSRSLIYIDEGVQWLGVLLKNPSTAKSLMADPEDGGLTRQVHVRPGNMIVGLTIHCESKSILLRCCEKWLISMKSYTPTLFLAFCRATWVILLS